MRVVGGKHRGRRLSEFSGRDIRPTSDRAREALFNILQGKVPGCRFLDAFAGTGAVGIEAVSRGAAEVVFVDAARESRALIERNLASLGERAQVIAADALSFLSGCGRPFDVAFFDPPYASDAGERAIALLAERGLIAPDGVAVLERDRPGGEVPGVAVRAVRRYGKNVFTFYGREEEQ